ncbi:FAD-dependent oxidoreductase [Paenibacillus sp. IB182496]|uniref:FAD-dependent oxidoreductase n=1 Tax=Paenibacillus sabuli TaxID=2772509 RepID=A0A927GTQ9_9BACL|nr:FAD-dependent oxidoreductase [Paenibacillus sabuli]MBD2847365.1 FAD-dependent oxidoreductase [Paenibacillus sabuli]
MYGIPLRALVSASVDNLMFAGRNISATHIAFSSTRVMATCGVMGQGAGTSAALATAQGMPPERAVQDEALVQLMQQRLLRQDDHLPGVSAAPNLASGARVRASSEQPEGAASQVVDGRTAACTGRAASGRSWSRPAASITG